MAYRNSTPAWKAFLKFLEANDAKVAYIHNMVTMSRSGRLDQMRHRRIHYSEFLIYSFKWAKSAEGHHYWGRINRAWLGQCNLVTFK